MITEPRIAFGALTLGFVLGTGTTPVNGQTSEYYLHTGDQNTFIVIQNGAIVRSWTPPGDTAQYQYPMVVRDTIRTMGANEGDIGGEYDLSGGDLGPRYTHPAGPSRSWDGATDGTNFYTIDTGGGVYKCNDNWGNPVLLFDTNGLGALAYDAANDSIWVSQFSSTTITEYSMSGTVIRSFSTGHSQNMALALDPADDTLWLHDRTTQGTYEQWSKDGTLLNRIAVPGMEGFNCLSGEFQFGGAADCLTLDVQNLVAGERANFTITNGTPGAKAVTVYGTQPGQTVVNGVAGYCATFGIKGVKQSKVLGGLNRSFDANGTIGFNIPIPGGTGGQTVFFQSAEHGTCPDECMSNLVEAVIQ